MLDDKGKFSRIERVAPGDTVDLDNDAEEKFLSGPRHLRVFVQAGGPEDPHGNDYSPNRLEAIAPNNNATPYPELEMGSTVVSGRTITRTDDDNPEGFVVAGSTEGPRSDNTEVRLRNEAQAEADKAYAEKREAQAKAAAKPQGKAGQSDVAKRNEQTVREAEKKD